MRSIRPAFATVLIALFLTACSAGGSQGSSGGQASFTDRGTSAPIAETTPQPAPETTPQATPGSTPIAPPATTTFAVGDVITITEGGDAWADFTVLEVNQANEFVDPDGFFNDTPSTTGYVYLTALVRYEAIANGVDYNPFDFQIFVDDQAVDGYAFTVNGPEPELGSGTLPAGRSAQGWLIFEVPPTGRVVLSYTGNIFLDEEPVFEVVLRDA